MSKWKTVREFSAKADDGTTVQIVERVELLNVRTMDDPKASPIEGMRELRTTDGRHVNRVSETEFEMLDPLRGSVRLRSAR